MFSKDLLFDLMMKSIPNDCHKIMCSIYRNDGLSEIKFYLSACSDKWVREREHKNISPDIYNERSEQVLKFNRENKVYDKESSKYWNLCTIEVSRDGNHSIDFTYRPELDEEHERETIESIGQELYDKYKHEDEEFRRRAREEPERQAEPEISTPETFTIPELLGFISTELTADLPTDWRELIVTAEVFEENGKQAVSMVTHYVTSGEPQHFVPGNSVGPMNALIKLQHQMGQDGHIWQKARLIFNPQGGVEVRPEE